ncbi:monovalent cation/H+ antiporter subunit D family protein [Corynebacterium sp. sy017]|uniref:monovalent cation/H+ antiporter subunit D family protein n=1 Tax=unclassified Corynebacterium TaxID=2624378 RepID=UPI001185DC51|nr:MULTISPECIES: monovalent cation/H+ antiporter subunit D family protein [unclassified Corynebacterium]MBP3089421.1 monovalent cation/H+ antiporter subunit D family protein [Corynebacterium sp. sy017]TSD90892.1 monovalent cation/H+ antiporter subunit D family protein [Corynebacterium sp. SY003]
MGSLLPLFLAIPLACVALATILPWRWARDGLALLTPLGTALAGVWLFAYTAAHGILGHSVGLYIGEVAITFVADRLSAIMIVVASIVTFASNWFAIVAGETLSRFYSALSLMLLSGVMGGLLTADLFNFFVFIEVMLLPSYGLMAMTGTWARLSAGRTFVLVNLATSTLLLIGVCIVYGVSGTVNIALLRGTAAGNGPMVVAMGIVVIALVIKAGLFPVHTWLPRSYPATSASVMGLFSGLHTKVAVYMLLRIYVIIFDLSTRWIWLIIAVCVASMLVGSFAGLGENSMRRVLAYQMVGGMPFIVITFAFSAGTDNAIMVLAAGIFYAIHHMVTVGSLILTAGALEETYGTDLLSRLSGIAKRDPWVAAVFAAGSLSVIGFPPFSGLWGKVGVVLGVAGAHNEQAWFVLAVIAVASFGAFLAMLRLWRTVFWGAEMNRERIPHNLHVPARRLAPGATLIVVSFLMFCAAGFVVDSTQGAARDLLNTKDYAQAVLSQEGAH